MKRKLKAGSTSQSLPIFVRDTSSTTGAGLGSLVYNSAGLAAKYRRADQSSWTTISLATKTLGTYTSGGFVTDAGPVTGGYEFDPPDAAFAAGAAWVQIAIYGATNMLATLIEIELDQIDYQDSVRAGLTALPNVVSGSAGAIVTSGTGTAQLKTTAGIVDLPAITAGWLTAAGIAADAITDAKVAADVTIASVTGSVGSVATGGITAGSFAAGAIDAAAIAANAIGASELAADAVAEIQSGLSTLDAAGVRSAVGLASANLDTQLAAVKTETAAILDDTGTSGVVVAAGSKSGYSLVATGLDLCLIDGVALRSAIQYIAALCAGKVSGAGSGTEIFKGLDGTTTRVTVTVDASGNRTGVVYVP